MPQSTRLRRWLTVVLASVGIPAMVFAQGASITGKVTDDNSVPLVGANVTIDALNISVGSNTAGQFTINIPGARVSGQSVVLRVRAIGYTPQTRTITITAGASSQNFSLSPDINKLSQVVITGVTAGTEQKKLPFVVAQVSEADMPVPNSNPLAELQGKVTGANIVSASGRPGSTPSIVLRGPQSIDATGRQQSPLFIVDGVEQIASASLSDINPNDIENIEVVKGAAAASLYGSRAGYGVISVTTKSGHSTGEGVRFNTRAEFGASEIAHHIALAPTTMMQMDPTATRFCITVAGQPTCSQSVDIYAETLAINQGGSTFALNPPQFTNDCGISTNCGPVRLRGMYQANQWPTTFDPVGQSVTNGPWTDINVDMTGKFGRANFFSSIGSLRQEGSIRLLDGYRRNSIRLNVDNTLGGNWTLSVRAYYARVAQDNNGGAFFSLTRQPAYANLLLTDNLGRLYVRSNAQVQGDQNENPLYSIQSDPQRGQNDRFQGNVQARWQPLSWLDGDFSIGYDRTNGVNNEQQDVGTRDTDNSGTSYLGFISFGNTFNQSYNAAMNWTARRDINRDLNVRFTVRGLYEAQDNNSNGLDGNAGLVVPGLFTANNVIPSSSNSVGSSVTSVRQIGMFAGVDLEYKERYILNTQIRRDGSSLFGSANQWANYGRGSFAWRASEEPFWPLKNTVNDFKLRAAVGQAGNRPSFAQQYQTFNISNGAVSANTLGNVNLRPELSTEVELGFDAEILHKYGLTVTHALGVVSSELLQVPPPAASGFANQWKNAGQLQNNTWEVSLNVPLIEKRDVQYSARFNFDQTKSEITGIAAGIAPFYYSGGDSGASAMYYVAPNVPYGAIYGRQFVEQCSQLPVAFQSQCGGAGSNFQKNNEGLIVWTGGAALTDGITKNLWMAVNGAATAPFGVTESWGNPIVLRDSLGHAITSQSMGNALPDFRYSVAQSFTFKKFTAYALLDAVKGNSVWNIGRAWSNGDFMNAEESQFGQPVGLAKPLGYYFRAGAPDNAGVGGLYDVLNTNSRTVENASYVKVREVSLGYRIGKIAGQGDWTVSLIGRNLYTFTKYKGYDPETGGTSGGASGSAALNAIDDYGFPNVRSITFQLSSSF